MSKKINRTLLKLTVLAVALNEVSAGAVSPAMAVLIDNFKSSYSVTQIMMLATVPQFCLIIFSPIYGKISEYFRRRTLLFFAFACFIFGGVLPAFSNSLPVILLWRAVLGIGIAITLPLSFVLIDDYFGGPEKDTIIGLNNSAQMVGGVVFQMLGGYLASIHWSYCFYVYLFPLWIIPLVYFYLPEPEKKAVIAPVAGSNSNIEQISAKVKIPGVLYLVCIGYGLFHVCFFTFVTNVAVLIQDSKFGNATSAGLAFTFMTVGAFLAGIIYGGLYKKARSITMAIGVFLVSFGFALCYFSTSLMMVLSGSLFSGFGIGIIMPVFMCKGAELAPPSKVAMSFSWLICAMGLGQTLQPIVFNPVLAFLNLQVGRSALGLASLALLVYSIIALIVNLRFSKKRSVAFLYSKQF
ncbi:MAG TPA: MFS transporter [Negativicutes bacterium]|jgi:MFS family permease